MIIFLKPDEQVEVQFISEGSVANPSTMKVFDQAIVVRHNGPNSFKGMEATAGVTREDGGVDVRFGVDLIKKNSRR